MNSNCLLIGIGCTLAASLVQLSDARAKTPEPGWCGSWASFPRGPFPPPSPHHSPAQATCQFGRVCFWGLFWSMQTVPCVCVSLSFSLSPVRSHSAPLTDNISKSIFQPFLKKKGDWLFQWPYSLCMCVFSPDLYMNILFVPWKPNEFAEVHLYSFDHGVFLIRTATCIVPKRIRSGFFLKRMSEAVGNESFVVPRSFCCDSCI